MHCLVGLCRELRVYGAGWNSRFSLEQHQLYHTPSCSNYHMQDGKLHCECLCINQTTWSMTLLLFIKFKQKLWGIWKRASFQIVVLDSTKTLRWSFFATSRGKSQKPVEEWQLQVYYSLYSIVSIIFEFYNIKLYASPIFMICYPR
jgi:hypothetical protein